MIERRRARAVAEEAHALHQRAFGHAGRRKDQVLARREIGRPIDPPDVGDAHGRASRLVFRRLDDEPRVDVAVEAPHRDGREHALRRPAGAHHGMDAGAGHRRDDRRRQVAIADQLDPRASGADVGNQLGVPGPVEHGDDQVVDVAGQRPRDGPQVVGDRGIEIDHVARRRRDDQLLHVEVGRVQQAAPLRRRKHGNRAGSAGGAEVRALERIDRDVHLRRAEPAAAVDDVGEPDLLADEQHRRLVALALADHDGAVDGHRVELAPHRRHRRLVRLGAVALPHRLRAGDGGLLDDAEELEREVGVHGGALPGHGLSVGAAARSGSPCPDGSRARSRPASACGPRACPRRSPRPCSCGRTGPPDTRPSSRWRRAPARRRRPRARRPRSRTTWPGWSRACCAVLRS